VSEINIGKPYPLGSQITPRGVNFSLVAPNAEFVEILIFESEDSLSPIFVHKLDKKFKSGPYWHVEIEGLKEGSIYAYRVHQKENAINKDYSSKVLIDPCSRGITGWKKYNRKDAMNKIDNIKTCLKSVVCDRDKFNFKDYPRPKRLWKESIIYELHVSSFVQEIDSSKNKAPIEVATASVAKDISPQGILKEKANTDFDSFKGCLRAWYKTGAYKHDPEVIKTWEDFKDIPAKECRKLLKLV